MTATALAERLVKGTRLDLAPAVAALAEQLDRRRDDALGSSGEAVERILGSTAVLGLTL